MNQVINLEEGKHAQRLAIALNKRVPTLKCANGATPERREDEAGVYMPIELAERVLRVLDGDETAACIIPAYTRSNA